MDYRATLGITAQQSIEWQSSVYIISRGVLWQLLRNYGKPMLMATVIIVLYSTLGFSE